MKKSMLILAFLSLMFALKSYAQYNWQYNTITATGGNGYLQTNNASYSIFFGNNGTQMTLTGGGDLNINGASNGYMINGSYVLWNNGLVSDIMVGVGAGHTVAGLYNTFVGYNAGYSTVGSASLGTGSWNTMAGYESGYHNVSGNGNNYYGKASGLWCGGTLNSMFGGHAGDGSGFGSFVSYPNTNVYNSDSNVFLGSYSAYCFYNGEYNLFAGTEAGKYTGSAAYSQSSLYNTYLGCRTAITNPGGNYNVLVGYQADAYNGSASAPSPVTNAAAFGADATVNYSNQLILGNNAQCVGIGESNDQAIAQPGPQWNLEISTENNNASGLPGLGGGTSGSTNPYGGTGYSGLRFRDLTSGSLPVIPSVYAGYGYPYPNGVLSVDGVGNVIYIGVSSLDPLGTCSTPLLPVLGNDPAIDLGTNPNNFWFEGNSTSTSSSDVIIGNNCGYTPKAKLDVYQYSSGSTNGSIGILVTNGDDGGCPKPVIGLMSVCNPVGRNPSLEVAGWFEAVKHGSCCSLPGDLQDAIFVPQDGGSVDLGFSSPCVPWAGTLNINGSVCLNGIYHTSDSTLKTNVQPIGNALPLVDKLNGVSFHYVPSVINDSMTAGLHYGFIAQQVERVIPNLVYTNPNGIKALAYTEIIPWLTEAIKEEKQTNDSLRTTLDSLRGAFKNIQNCLNSLCTGGGYAPVHHSGSNGNSGDSNSAISNVQEVTLSGSMNSPLLYQNIPNPFTSGTKINYYLPLGTQGATIVFYDTYGNQIKTVPLSQTGNGTLNITPDNLSAGIYSYSLIVNNSVVDTKRMILQK